VKIFCYIKLILCLAVFVSAATASDSPPAKKDFTKASMTDICDYYDALLPQLKTMDKFKSVDAFEKYYGAYFNNCESYANGCSGELSCNNLVMGIWHREDSISYEKLNATLDGNGKKLLATSVDAWNKMTDMTLTYVRNYLNQMYHENSGSYGLSMASNDARAMLLPIIKLNVILNYAQAGIQLDNEPQSSAYWDKELNSIYKKLAAKLNPNTKHLLKKTQRQWIKARDTQLALENYCLNKKYPDTTNARSRAEKAALADRFAALIIKQRTLMFQYQFKIIPYDKLSESYFTGQ